MLMLPSGAPTINCQRCRLRETLLQLRLQRQARLPSRSFSHRPLRSFSEGANVVKRKEKDIVWKHFGGGGKVIGRAGRRQRVVPAKLSTKILDERVSPSQIIVFQDVRGQSGAPRPATPVQDDPVPHKVLSAKQIEDSIAGRSNAPEEAEVNTSIDELRPDETSVDETGFENLKQTLLQGYNYRQLSRYLLSRLGRQDTSFSNELPELNTCQWQVGQTPLEKRHKNIIKNTHRSKSKPGVVDQILRLVWDVTVQSDISSVGELEMKLQPWQRSMLFDLATSDGKPYYERLITPAILLEASRVYQYQPDNVVRVVGRRPVAEEVAKQLRLAVLGSVKVKLDLAPFISLGSSAEQKTTPETIFQDEDLRYVSDLSKCIIVPERGSSIVIYGFDHASTRNAQRTLLSLLGLPAHRSFDGVSTGPIRTAAAENTITADVVDMGLRRPLRQSPLSRTYKPVPRLLRAVGQAKTSNGNPQIEKLVEVLQKRLDEIEEPMNGSALWAQTSGSYWRNEIRLSGWEAEFCKLLFEQPIEPAGHRRRSKSKAQQSKDLEMQSVLAGTEALLSYFVPSHLPRPLNLQMGEKRGKIVFDRRLPYLNAHFVPCPPPGMSTERLPHITMRFRFSAPTSTDEPRELRLLGLRAKVDEQRLKVPLPGQSMDVCFRRSSSMVSHSTLVHQNDDISQFCSHLRDSVQFGKGALDAPSALTIPLPRFLVDGKQEGGPANQEEVGVRYMFERFEQVQSVEFDPPRDIATDEDVDGEVLAMIKELPAGCLLDYREVDGGAVYGNSTSLNLRVSSNLSGKRIALDAKDDQVDSSLPKFDSELEATQSEAVSQTERPNDLEYKQLNTAEQEPQVSQNGDAHAEEENAESSSDLSANESSGLVASALRIAGLLTRAHAGTLQRRQR